ncbi:MAG: PCRF domain-containing protein [Chloroflexi bacterium]|nr:PCRF domain-containing protein [Chloroflexota bacterium]
MTSPSPDSLRAHLSNFAQNITERAQAGGQPSIYFRDSEIDQILQALASPLKGRVVVIGPARVGKSAVLQSVAARILSGECPPELAGKEVWRLTPNGLPGLSARGNWQAALDQLMSEWSKHPEVILYFDEITRAARLGSFDDDEGGITPDVATVLAASFKRLPGLCLAEANDYTWRRFADSYADYEQLFLPVRVEEPDSAQARQIIHRVAEDLSILHGIPIAEAAIERAFDLSQRYSLDRAQPGKTIDVLRDTLAVAKTGGAQLIADDVTRRFGEQSGLPRMLLDDTVPFNEDEVLKFFRARVLAQDQAVEAIVQSLSLLKARVNNPLRPMGVFLFLGPTGVGKTELARTLAEYLYSNRDRIVRFNMGDYAHPHQHTELFGNPYATDAIYRRGQLTNRLAGKIFSVLVLDEFEKAHPFIYQRFLQLFDEGILINGNDETVNLRNSIIILTSNFGAQLMQQEKLGFKQGETMEAREKRVLSETEDYFTPEFMNRIDAVCIFHPLSRAVMADIARREIGDLLKRDGLTRRNFEAEIADEVIEQVVALGYSARYGARYLKRQIEKTITYPLAREINAMKPEASGGSIRLYMRHGRIHSGYYPPAAEPAAQPAPALRSEPTLTLIEIREALPILAARVEALEELHGFAEAQAERAAILSEMSDVGFWNDQSSARRKLDAYQRASGTVEMLNSLRNALDALTDGAQSESASLESLARPYRYLLNELPRIEFTSWLSGPRDSRGAYLRIGVKHKSAAARQWAGALAKMYLGWARQRGFAASLLGEDLSLEGRSFSVMMVVSGFGAYGLLQGETGAHKLVQTVKAAGQESLQRIGANVSVLPELDDDDLPPPPPNLEVSVKEINRGGLIIPRLTAQAAIRHPATDHRLTLASNLPPDDLAAEATRILWTEAFLDGEGESRPAPPPGGIVRTYARSTKEKGVHDHRTGQRTIKVKQVLDGEALQEFLNEGLKQRSGV